jgi:hypothetical protein
VAVDSVLEQVFHEDIYEGTSPRASTAQSTSIHMADTQLKNSVWRVKGSNGFDGLDLEEDVPIEKVGDYDCLVKIEAVSLNFRDLMIAQVW